MTGDRTTYRSAHAMRVFEAAARHLSFTAAAAELHVTQVAVSRMVARLEDELGLRLFLRSRTGLQLTEDGGVLQEAVADGFSRIERGFLELRRRQAHRNTVTLSLSNGFTSHWLMPRYVAFQEAVPGINLRFQLTGAILQGDVDQVDLGMRMHDPSHGLQHWDFCPEVVLPVCSPDYLARMGALDAAADTGAHTLIHLTATTLDWEDYCARSGPSFERAGPALGFSDSALVLQAALLGQGVALGWLSAVSYALRSGLLVPASARAVPTARTYDLVARPGPLREEVLRVRDWLLDQMRADLREVGNRYGFLRAPPRVLPPPDPGLRG